MDNKKQDRKERFKTMIRAVEARGFVVRKIDDYVWAINRNKYDFVEFTKRCRKIINEYPVVEKGGQVR